MAMDIVIDFGNAWMKWYVPATGEKGRVRHAIAPLNKGEWAQVSSDGHPQYDGYLSVLNGHYVVGDRARRHIVKDKPKGAARYRRDYYGVGLVYVLSQIAPLGHRNIALKASYAPGDYMHVASLVKAAKQDWKVSHAGHDKPVTYNVKSVETFDEPFGGWANVVFTKEGFPQKRAGELLDSTTYVLDIGGHTVDGVAIDPNGQIDFSSALSIRAGVLHIMQTFENELRSAYPAKFRDTGDIDDARLERALDTGVFKFGKTELDMQVAADGLKNQLVNEIYDMFVSRAGGIANYDVVVLTGGGAALLHDKLQESMPDADFRLAASADDVQFANVLGGHKLFEMMKRVNEND